MRTLSPFLTVKSTFLPSSFTLPVPRATTLPSCGFSLAVSGIMIPPFFVSCSSIGCTSLCTLARGCLFVKLGADFLELVLQVIVSPLHRVGVVLIDRFTHRGDGVLDLLLLVTGNLIAQFFKLFLALIREHVGVVLDFDRFLGLLILFGVRFGFALHLLDFLFRKT